MHTLISDWFGDWGCAEWLMTVSLICLAVLFVLMVIFYRSTPSNMYCLVNPNGKADLSHCINPYPTATDDKR